MAVLPRGVTLSSQDLTHAARYFRLFSDTNFKFSGPV